jgi:hypothetical protein
VFPEGGVPEGTPPSLFPEDVFMLGIGKLVSAVKALAENLSALAVTVRTINDGVRERLALDHQDDGPVQIDHAPRRRNVKAKS